jgi:hypothetical protein
MNWKEFIKPDWRKIVLFVIIFIIEFSYYFNSSVCFCPLSACATAQTEQATARMQNISIDIEPCDTCYSLPWEQCPCDRYCGKPDTITSIMIAIYSPLFTIAILIIPYLLSCLIVWVYDKYRKKK